MPTLDFDTRFAQLCEAFELTTRNEWWIRTTERNDGGVSLKYREIQMYPEGQVPTGYGGISAQTNYPDSEPQGQQANHNLEFTALAHNLMPAIKAEMERLRDPCAVAGFHICGPQNEAGEMAVEPEDYIRELRAELSTKNEEVERLRGRYQEYFKETVALRRDLAGANKTIESQASQLTEARARIETLEIELDSHKPHCSRGAVIGESIGVKP